MRWLLLLSMVGTIGCQGEWLKLRKSPAATRSQEQASLPTSPEAQVSVSKSADAIPGQDVPVPEVDVMAYVNGSPVYMNRLYGLLVLADGMRMAQHVVACELVDQAAADRKLSVREAEVQAEHETTLERMFPDVPQADQRERLLDQLLVRRVIPLRQWRESMRRNVLLGKLSADQVAVTDQELTEAYEDKYGRKVIVRHIQSANSQEAEEVLDRIRQGADFAELAKKVSKGISRADGGLLPPIGPRPRSLPQVLHQAAWAMQDKGGVFGPIKAGTSYHILYLEDIVEPQDVPLADVRDQLEVTVRSGKLQQAKNRLLLELVRKSEIRWVDPILAGKADSSDQSRIEELP